MSLAVGTRLGSYEISAPLGSGGMGEVYRARDRKLNRDVALKVLSGSLANDADYMARFQHEAQVLASLNHPNIAHIYGLEEDTIVMELVEGQTLAERISQGALPLDEALLIARQVAEGLEYAHDIGVIHRDLKPANIKITPNGVVKILDFGLAKVAEQSAMHSNPASSPTLTIRSTQVGTILGTAAYMSPEQARGKPVDRRADIWAFGAVLFEMLSGKLAFEGDSVTDILASVVKLEPGWSALPPTTPPVILRLIKRCLVKDRAQRLQAIGEARIAIDEYRADPSGGVTVQVQAARPASTKLPWAVAGALLLLAIGLCYIAYHHVTEETRVLKFSVLPPEKGSADMPVVSPDGRRIAFVGTQDGRSELWVRELDGLLARRLPGTEGATYPFWSPDSRTIAFFQTGKLKKIEAAGGPAFTLCDATGGRGGAWNQNGVIVFNPSVTTALYRVSAGGGNATPLTELEVASGENAHRMPWFLPDDHHFLYTARNSEAEKNTVYVTDLNSKERKKVMAASSNVEYAPPGYLLFLRDRALMAQRFDASSTQIKGDAVAIAESIRYDGLNLFGRFSISQDGALVYSSGSGSTGSGAPYSAVQLMWCDRSGKTIATLGTPGVYLFGAISPDGHTVALSRVDQQTGSTDIWLSDQIRGTESRFTFNGLVNSFPVWSPDGAHIVFSSFRVEARALFQKALSGAAQDEILDKSNRQMRASDCSRDGRYLIESVLDRKTQLDIWVLPLFGDRKAFPYLHSDFNEMYAKLSPNGQWLAYTSDETKRNEVYVQSFPNPGGKWQISTNGGQRPIWSRDGKELFFIEAGRKMMAVEVKSGPTFQAGVPKPLFDAHFGGNPWFDVSKDGRFLIPTRVDDGAVEPITVVVNWPGALKK